MKEFPTGSPTGASKRVFYVLMFLTLLSFGTFFFVDTRASGERNVPAYTSLLLGFMLLLLFFAVIVSVWSVVSHYRTVSHADAENRIPIKKVTLSVAGGTCGLLLLSYLVASSSAIRINAESYANVFWLKTAGMFIIASTAMIVAVVCVILYDYVRRR